jgi:hypothetical protein
MILTKGLHSYLVGEIDSITGEFWCSGEYQNEEFARKKFNQMREEHPKKHCQLVQQIVMHTIVETSYPQLSQTSK